MVMSTLWLLGVLFSFECSVARFLKSQPRVRGSPPELESFLESSFVLSVDKVLVVEGLGIVVDEDDEDDEDCGEIRDSGDFPGFLGCGAAIVSSVTEGGVDEGLGSILTGDEDMVSFFLPQAPTATRLFLHWGRTPLDLETLGLNWYSHSSPIGLW